jgi:hypothetical protein
MLKSRILLNFSVNMKAEIGAFLFHPTPRPQLSTLSSITKGVHAEGRRMICGRTMEVPSIRQKVTRQHQVRPGTAACFHQVLPPVFIRSCRPNLNNQILTAVALQLVKPKHGTLLRVVKPDL